LVNGYFRAGSIMHSSGDPIIDVAQMTVAHGQALMMTTVTFARGYAANHPSRNYHCTTDGDHYGRYVRAEVAEKLYAAVVALVRNADCTCEDMGGDGLLCNVCEGRAAIRLAEES